MKKYLFIVLYFLPLCIAAQNIAWMKQVGNWNDDWGKGMTVDAAGNIYFCGDFSSTVDFDPGPGSYSLTSVNSYDAFIVKLDPAGNFVWAKQFGGNNSQDAVCVTVDPSGNIYVGGWFNSITDFDPGPGTYTVQAIGSGGYICKLDPNGNFIWARTLISSGNWEWVNSLTLDVSGNVYSTGEFRGLADFDPSAATYTMNTVGAADVFIYKLDQNGNFLMAKQLGGTSNDYGARIGLDAGGNIYTVGNFNSAIADFDPGAGTFTMSPVGASDMYISKLDPSGNFVWAKQIGGAAADNASSLAFDGSGNFYTAGHFQSTNVDFDPGPGTFTLSAQGGWDFAVNKFDNAGNFIWSKQIKGSGNEVVYSMTADAAGNTFCTGYFDGTNTDFDPGPGVYTLTAAFSTQNFVSKLDANGNLVWAVGFQNTGGGGSQGADISVGPLGDVYTCGTFNGTIDADPGPVTYTVAALGNREVFIHKLSSCALPPPPSTSTVPVIICTGGSTTISATGIGNISWYASPTSTAVIGTGSVFTTPTLTAITYFYCEDSIACFKSF
jgi:hypothetical protein